MLQLTVNAIAARADGIMESDISSDIPFLKAPYIVDTTQTSKSYTPTLSYNVKVNYYFVDSSNVAAQNILYKP